MTPRMERLLRATLNRISERGDMNIRIRSSTLIAIIRQCGFDWRDDHDHEYPHREVDAMALEALCRLAGGNIGHAYQA